MNEIIKKDILSILSGIVDILKVKEEKDIMEMKELSNHTIHNASIFQDEDSVSIAILVYSLSKVIERKQGELNYDSVIALLKSATGFLKKNDVDDYRKTINKSFKLISSLDSKLKLYIEEVINQAQIKKGSKLYEHGISMARASSILGISEWELMNYIGKTNITEIPLEEPVSVKERLKFARRLFS
jgi:hypothetical protein|tara:strand:+ start:484 stop:1041 length:558 start_codon:yes stop_codon:yes gene_type:complete